MSQFGIGRSRPPASRARVTDRYSRRSRNRRCARPALAAFTVFPFLGVWNDLPVAAFGSIVILIVVFLALQRYFGRSLLAWSVQG